MALRPVMALALLLLPGCVVTEPGRARRHPALDPCAERLHDLSGKLLMHHAAHGEMPASLADLDSPGKVAARELRTCPVTHTEYRYDPTGRELPGHPGRLIVYDATPAHDSGRWAVLLIRGRAPLTTRVVWLPEDAFTGPPLVK